MPYLSRLLRDELGDEDVKQIADELSLEYQGNFSLLKIPPTDISSTQIRKDIRMGEQYFRKVPKSRRRLYLNTPFILPKTEYRRIGQNYE